MAKVADDRAAGCWSTANAEAGFNLIARAHAVRLVLEHLIDDEAQRFLGVRGHFRHRRLDVVGIRGGQQHCCQDADDGDNNHEFDEGETPL